MLRSPLNDVTSTLFPSPCRICSGPLLRVTLAPVCDDCFNRLASSPSELCARCGEALDFAGYGETGPRHCRACNVAPPAFERAVSFGTYQGEMRRALHLLKYERLTAMARPLGAKLAQAILQLEADAPQQMTVVAVPLFAARQNQRGYNQSILLTDAALTQLRRLRPLWKLEAAHNAFIRTRDTETHFQLAPHQRRENLKGAFKVTDKSKIQGRSILLIDDIYTTGATARECSRALLRAGASTVWVATLARAQMELFTRWQPPEAPVH